jgi:Domain of unknown function (DUF5666)
MKLSALLLVLIFAGVAFAGQASTVDDKKAGDAKEARWQGTIVRMSKDQSSLSIRGGQGNMESIERTVLFDETTKWTKQGKPAQMDEFKDGSFVIVLGQADDKGVLHATRIDLRQPR